MCSGVVERMDDDERVAMAVGVSGQPSGDGVAGALVVRGVREIMFFPEIMVEKNGRVLALLQPPGSLPDIARYIQNMRGKFLPKPSAAHLVILDKKDAS